MFQTDLYFFVLSIEKLKSLLSDVDFSLPFIYRQSKTVYKLGLFNGFYEISDFIRLYIGVLITNSFAFIMLIPSKQNNFPKLYPSDPVEITRLLMISGAM